MKQRSTCHARLSDIKQRAGQDLAITPSIPAEQTFLCTWHFWTEPNNLCFSKDQEDTVKEAFFLLSVEMGLENVFPLVCPHTSWALLNAARMPLSFSPVRAFVFSLCRRQWHRTIKKIWPQSSNGLTSQAVLRFVQVLCGVLQVTELKSPVAYKILEGPQHN